MSTQATEIRPGCWEFDAGRFTWRWYDKGGINTFFVVDSPRQEEKSISHSKDLDHALQFAEGFWAGWTTYREQMEKVLEEDDGDGD